jgi:aconitase A
MLGPGETCITAGTRNFKGRMGDPGARIYPASPATVAASAIAGHIATAGNRLGWVDQVRAGDIIVGGLNYGMGSSHPAARSLRNLGIAALLAESINGLFFRNAVNFGLLALGCWGRCGISGRANRRGVARRTSRCATATRAPR